MRPTAIRWATLFAAFVAFTYTTTICWANESGAKTTPPSGISLSTKAAIKGTLDQIAISKCGIVINRDIILGYRTKKHTAVYQNKCSGFCPSRIDITDGSIAQLYECRPNLYRSIKVYTAPLWYTYLGLPRFKAKFAGLSLVKQKIVVSQLAGCGCAPRRCTVGNRTYAHGATVYNGCGDRCKCQFGKVINCCRRRKSFTKMPMSERSRYTQAVYDLSKGTGGATAAMKTQYDAMIAQHTAWFHLGIHTPDEFLPWHRWYLKNFEDLLRKVDICITVPYWDWSGDAADPWGSPLWNPGQSWFGAGSAGNCVPDGPFTIPFYLTPSEGVNLCLRRHRIGSVPTAMQVATMLADNNFNSFANTLDGMHGGVHCSIHGTMCSVGSANAPEFFLHHANVDRLWAKWQAKGPAFQMAFTAGQLDNPMNGGATPRQLMLLGYHMGVCVEYAVPRWIIDIFDILKQLPQAVLRGIPAAQPQWTQQAGWWLANVRNLPQAEVRELVQQLEDRLYVSPELIPTDGNDFATRFGVRLEDISAAVDEWVISNPSKEKASQRLRTLIENLRDDAQFAL